MSIEAMKLALEAAYLAGFNASGEGYNGEYPFGDKNQNPEHDSVWCKDRDNALEEALAKQEQGEPDYKTLAIQLQQDRKQEQGEPVAVKRMLEWAEDLKRLSNQGQHMNIPSNLSAGTCWELATELEWFVKHCKCDGLATTPQQDWKKLPPEEPPLVKWAKKQGEPKQEDYLSKAYRLANELRCHLAIAPAPQQRTWVGLSDEQFAEACRLAENGNYLVAFQRIQNWIKESNT